MNEQKDRFGRQIDYMRISVTDHCNLRCVYCMPEEAQQFLPKTMLLTLEQWEMICKAAAGIGICKIRITGGEPLMREDIVELVARIANIKGIKCVVMTTNGVLLAQKAKALQKAGLQGVNISLDTLDREQYQALTKRDALSDVQKSIAVCQQIGLQVKINCVPVSGFAKQDFLKVAMLAKQSSVAVRFIEMMPIGAGTAYQPIQNATIQKQLTEKYGIWTQVQTEENGSPATYWDNENFLGKIGFISPQNHRFCHACNRIRVTAEGKLKLCLHHSADGDLKMLLEKGADTTQLQRYFAQKIWQKPKDGYTTDEKRPMWKIGG